MTQVCHVCTHSEREAIDRALVEGVDSLRDIAGRYELSKDSVARHADNHLPGTLVKAKEAEDRTHAEDLLQRFDALLEDAKRIGEAAEAARNYRAALAGVREMVRINELLLEVRGELNRNPIVNVIQSVEWVTVRTAVLKALEPYPEARIAVAKALSDGNPSE